VGSSATLGGTGTVNGIQTAVGSFVAPGSVPTTAGTLTANGATGAILAGSTVVLDINSASADRLASTATGVVVRSGATLTLNLTSAGALGQVYIIVSSSAGFGGTTFANAAPGSDILVGGRVYRVTYSGTAVTLTDEGTLSALMFVQQPTTTVHDATISPAPTVAVLDQAGNIVTSANALLITLAIGSNPSGGTLSGTVSQTTVKGIATFAGLSIDKVVVGYTLIASTSSLPFVASVSFNIVPGTAVRYVVS